MKNIRLLVSLCLVLTLLLSGCQQPLSDNTEESAVPDVSAESSAEPSESSQEPESATSEPEILYVPHGDFIWEVKGGEGTVYLMGTMHVLGKDYALSPGIVELFDAADALAVESNLIDPAVSMGALQYMYYQDRSALLSHLSERAQTHLINMAEDYGIDMSPYEYYHASNLSSLFTMEAARQIGYTAIGVDMMLLLRANDQLKPILELEDYHNTYQGFFDLSDETLERVTILTITPLEETKQELIELYEVFLTGDDDILKALLEEESEDEYLGGDGLPVEFQDEDEAYNLHMITNRNKIMAASIEEYLQKDETIFVAAGVAHFIGEGTVNELLEEKGYEVVRIYPNGEQQKAA